MARLILQRGVALVFGQKATGIDDAQIARTHLVGEPLGGDQRFHEFLLPACDPSGAGSFWLSNLEPPGMASIAKMANRRRVSFHYATGTGTLQGG
jgi:hypothetical protein